MTFHGRMLQWQQAKTGGREPRPFPPHHKHAPAHQERTRGDRSASRFLAAIDRRAGSLRLGPAAGDFAATALRQVRAAIALAKLIFNSCGVGMGCKSLILR